MKHLYLMCLQTDQSIDANHGYNYLNFGFNHVCLTAGWKAKLCSSLSLKFQVWFTSYHNQHHWWVRVVVVRNVHCCTCSYNLQRCHIVLEYICTFMQQVERLNCRFYPIMDLACFFLFFLTWVCFIGTCACKISGVCELTNKNRLDIWEEGQ